MTHDSGSGCFSGITRLLLCKGSLQTHPSDDTITITKPIPINDHVLNKGFKNSTLITENLKVEAPVKSTNTPGVVARLMGLESLPDPNIVTRSRSVNFMDYYYFLDSSDLEQNQKIQKQQQHRRVRTCVSFREAKISGNEHDLFVFSLDDHNKVIEKNEKKSENVIRQNKNIQEVKNKKVRVERFVLNKNKNQELKNKKVIVERAVSKKNKKENNKNQGRISSWKGGSSGFVSRVNRKDGVPVKKVKTPVKRINQKEVLVESKFIKNHPCNGNDEVLVYHHLPLSGKKCSPKESNYKVKKSTEQKKAVTKKEYTEEEVKIEKKIEFENIEIERMCLYFGEHIVDLLVEKFVEELLQH